MWKTVKLPDVCDINPRTSKELTENTVVSFIPMQSVSENSKSIVTEVNRFYKDVSKGYTSFEQGDLLIAKITPCFENGKLAIATIKNQFGFGSSEFHVFRVKDQTIFDIRYLYFFLQQSNFISDAVRNMTGTAGQKRVPKQFFERLEIPLPPIEVQKKNAEILEKADSLIALREKQLAKMDELLQSVFLDMFGDPVSNPKGWEIGTIQQLTTKTQYGSGKKADEIAGAFPMLRMNNITYLGGWDFKSLKYVDLDEVEQKKYLVHKGEILFNRTNSKELVGKTAVYREDIPMAYAGYLVKLITNKLANAEYISGYLNSKRGKAILVGMAKSIVGMANINAEELKTIPIAIPPVSLQDEFANHVYKIEALKKPMQLALDEQKKNFDALTQKAFRGDLV